MKRIVIYSLAAAAAVGVIGVSSLAVSALDTPAKAHGMQRGMRMGEGRGQGRQQSLEARAAVFGMTVDELSKALETKTMSQIAVERGMDEETFRAKMAEVAKARWEARGLSKEEIAKRMAEREARHAANRADHAFGSGEGNHMGGYGKNNRR